MNFSPKKGALLPIYKKNLLLLTESYLSISELCRKLNINRQQFNKYLSGQHTPSQKVLHRIADYFMLHESDFFLSPIDFRNLYEGLENNIPMNLRKSQKFNQFLTIAKDSNKALESYLGVYYRYHFSSIYKEKVLRSVTCLYEADGLVQYVTIERFPLIDNNQNKLGYTFRYHGLCTLLGDRIFMIDFESRQNNEITFSILTPQHRTPKRFLYGILNGVASSSFRQPFATRMMLQFISKGTIKKNHLKQATLLDINDENIPLEAVSYFKNESNLILWGGE